VVGEADDDLGIGVYGTGDIGVPGDSPGATSTQIGVKGTAEGPQGVGMQGTGFKGVEGRSGNYGVYGAGFCVQARHHGLPDHPDLTGCGRHARGVDVTATPLEEAPEGQQTYIRATRAANPAQSLVQPASPATHVPNPDRDHGIGAAITTPMSWPRPSAHWQATIMAAVLRTTGMAAIGGSSPSDRDAAVGEQAAAVPGDADLPVVAGDDLANLEAG